MVYDNIISVSDKPLITLYKPPVLISVTSNASYVCYIQYQNLHVWLTEYVNVLIATEIQRTTADTVLACCVLQV